MGIEVKLDGRFCQPLARDLRELLGAFRNHETAGSLHALQPLLRTAILVLSRSQPQAPSVHRASCRFAARIKTQSAPVVVADTVVNVPLVVYFSDEEVSLRLEATASGLGEIDFRVPHAVMALRAVLNADHRAPLSQKTPRAIPVPSYQHDDAARVCSGSIDWPAVVAYKAPEGHDRMEWRARFHRDACL